MEVLGYDEVKIDRYGNVLGRIGSGEKAILFDSHTDTVKVYDEEEWDVSPFGGEIQDGYLWGRGSVDMKSGLAAAVYAAALAKQMGWATGKTIYVSGSVFEEDCDGEGLKHLMEEQGSSRIMRHLRTVINIISTVVKNQIIIRTKGSRRTALRQKGAARSNAEIIQRVEQTNRELMKKEGRKGTLVLSQISSKSVSLNAVPSDCEIYLDRRMVVGETEQTIRGEMECLIEGKNAKWEIGTLHRTTWTGEEITYEPFHLA
jgi:putative selenium metabolism hydrolase